MKVAILHEMLVKLWGAEKVVETFLEIFPWADLFTLIYDENIVWTTFPKSTINKQVFWLKTQKRYELFHKQRLCFPFMAESIEQLDFSSYDLVLCSSSWFAHWAITKPETKFIVYYHSPAWYLWHQNFEYQKMILSNHNIFVGFFIKFYFNYYFKDSRIWDFIAWQRNDFIIAASNSAKKRIEKYYKRDVDKVIFPPVEVNKFINNSYEKKGYYLTISALSELKRLHIMIDAFNNMPDKQLKIVWVWDLENKLKWLVKNNNIEFLWYKSGFELVELLWESKWWVYSWVEDFWIAAIESMASWRPVFWFRQWWFKETIIPLKTWGFFEDWEWKDFVEKFKIFDKNIDENLYDVDYLKNYSTKFSKQNFIDEIIKITKKD